MMAQGYTSSIHRGDQKERVRELGGLLVAIQGNAARVGNRFPCPNSLFLSRRVLPLPVDKTVSLVAGDEVILAFAVHEARHLQQFIRASGRASNFPVGLAGMRQGQRFDRTVGAGVVDRFELLFGRL